MQLSRRTIVLDPGHGGSQSVGGSSPNRATGPNGLLEKDVALDLTRRVRQILEPDADVSLTRNEDINLSLADRAGRARERNADLFLSLHLNTNPDASRDGSEVWVARGASAATREFARALLARLGEATGAPSRGVHERNLGALLPSRHSERTLACLAEVAYLSHPEQARRLADEGYRQRIAQAIASALREHTSAPRVALSLEVGKGSPFAAEAVDPCWKRCEQFRLNAKSASNPNVISAGRIRRETGISVDANPFSGITKEEIEAVVRASYNAFLMPEALLALWAKEGSTRSVTTATAVPTATNETNAKTIFRSRVFYEDLGADHFLVTTRPAGGDNVWDDSDAAAAGHERHFAARVRDLVTGRLLDEDISSAINAELAVSRTGGRFAVLPSTRFYALSLLLMDALFHRFLRNTFPQLSSISEALNYIQWNTGTTRFREFLTSAESHRKENAHLVDGQPISIEQWALHTVPKASEWRQARVNGIRFLHYMDSYRPIFEPSINLIKPGIEDLRSPQTGPTRTAEVEAFSVRTFPNFGLFTPRREFVRMPLAFDDYAGSASALTFVTTSVATEAQLKARKEFVLDFNTTDGVLERLPMEEAVFASPFFRKDSAGNIEAALDAVICYPADPADADKLAAGGPFPVAVLLMGNHDAIQFTTTPLSPTVPGSPPRRKARPTGVKRVIESHLGYSSRAKDAAGNHSPYLQEELAKYGYVSISVSTNGANMLNLLLNTRAEYVMQALDLLRRLHTDASRGNRFHGCLDLNRVALIGHSRGGDAIIRAIELNAARPAARKFGIRAAVSLAPTDMTGVLDDRPGVVTGQHRLRVNIGHNVFYLVVYGSHDGDVSGGGDGARELFGTGFRHYDRSTTHRAMAFIHGATHNRFNRIWNDLPNDGDPSHTSADTSDARMLSRARHERLAREYIVGWLRYVMLSDFPEQQLFNGDRANSLGTTVSHQWKFGRNLKTIERFEDTLPTKNTLGGAVSKPAYVSEIPIDSEDPPDADFPGLRLPMFPHDDRVAKAAPVTGTRAPMRMVLPDAHKDVSGFNQLTFRVTKQFPVATASDISTAALPDFSVTLEDHTGKRKTVSSGDVQAANPRKTKPYFRRGEDGPGERNLTKCNLETWRVPLSSFTGTGGVSLAQLRAVEFDFSAAAGQPEYVDTISFVRL